MKQLASTRGTDGVVFFGDPHGDFKAVADILKRGVPERAFLLGDFDLDRPLDVELSELVAAGADVHFIHGNHDADTEAWHDFVFMSPIAERNLTGRVVDVDGVKIAGLGGVFHAEIWHPNDGDGTVKFSSRQDFLDVFNQKTWRGGLPLRHRSTIFPEDVNALASLEADILISHEAPSSHRYGHRVIDDLAEIMGVKVIIHGHLHRDYRAVLPNGIKVIGIEKAGVVVTSFGELLAA